MSLTPAELAASRAFRAAQREMLGQRNAEQPPGMVVSVFIRNDRHDCAARGGRSYFLELREHYAFSQWYVARKDGTLVLSSPDYTVAALEGEVIIPAKRFGWIWTEGKCAACGLTARSSAGRLVDPEIRPPVSRAIIT